MLDFVAFQLLWQDTEPAADCNHDESLDIEDFVCFAGLYNGGC